MKTTAFGELDSLAQQCEWQDGFQPKELNGNRFLAQKIRYVHANPVVAGFVEQPEDWVYSSAVNYADNIGLVEVIVLQEAQMFNG